MPILQAAAVVHHAHKFFALTRGRLRLTLGDRKVGKDPFPKEIRRPRPPSSSRARQAALARQLRPSSLNAERGSWWGRARLRLGKTPPIESGAASQMPI